MASHSIVAMKRSVGGPLDNDSCKTNLVTPVHRTRTAEVHLQEDLETPVIYRLPHGIAVVLTIAKDATVSPNQDAAALIPFGESDCLLVVADGMGGTRNGAAAAAAAVKHLVQGLPERSNEIQMRTAILDAIEAANAHIVSEIP